MGVRMPSSVCAWPHPVINPTSGKASNVSRPLATLPGARRLARPFPGRQNDQGCSPASVCPACWPMIQRAQTWRLAARHTYSSLKSMGPTLSQNWPGHKDPPSNPMFNKLHLLVSTVALLKKLTSPKRFKLGPPWHCCPSNLATPTWPAQLVQLVQLKIAPAVRTCSALSIVSQPVADKPKVGSLPA